MLIYRTIFLWNLIFPFKTLSKLYKNNALSGWKSESLPLYQIYVQKWKLLLKEGSVKEEKQLTSQLLGCSQESGLQDESALPLPWQLFHQEGLLGVENGGRVPWASCEECSVSQMLHFNPIGIFMPYIKNLNVDFRLTGAVTMCATNRIYHNLLLSLLV